MKHTRMKKTIFFTFIISLMTGSAFSIAPPVDTLMLNAKKLLAWHQLTNQQVAIKKQIEREENRCRFIKTAIDNKEIPTSPKCFARKFRGPIFEILRSDAKAVDQIFITILNQSEQRIELLRKQIQKPMFCVYEHTYRLIRKFASLKNRSLAQEETLAQLQDLGNKLRFLDQANFDAIDLFACEPELDYQLLVKKNIKILKKQCEKIQTELAECWAPSARLRRLIQLLRQRLHNCQQMLIQYQRQRTPRVYSDRQVKMVGSLANHFCCLGNHVVADELMLILNKLLALRKPLDVKSAFPAPPASPTL